MQLMQQTAGDNMPGLAVGNSRDERMVLHTMQLIAKEERTRQKKARQEEALRQRQKERAAKVNPASAPHWVCVSQQRYAKQGVTPALVLHRFSRLRPRRMPALADCSVRQPKRSHAGLPISKLQSTPCLTSCCQLPRCLTVAPLPYRSARQASSTSETIKLTGSGTSGRRRCTARAARSLPTRWLTSHPFRQKQQNTVRIPPTLAMMHVALWSDTQAVLAAL